MKKTIMSIAIIKSSVVCMINKVPIKGSIIMQTYAIAIRKSDPKAVVPPALIITKDITTKSSSYPSRYGKNIKLSEEIIIAVEKENNRNFLYHASTVYS